MGERMGHFSAALRSQVFPIDAMTGRAKKGDG